MGEYILKKLLGMNNKCEICRKPKYHHIEVVYWQHLYTMIDVEGRFVDEQSRDAMSA